ncbi:trigger factor [Methylomagnum sp.]
MQVSVETTSELSRKMTIQVPEETIQEKVSARLKSLSNQVKIDGFRPGKVPQSVVKKRYGPQVREEVLSDMIQTTFQDAIRNEKLMPAGAPQIIAHKADEGEGLEYEANFEVMPEFVLMPLETLEVKRFVSEVTDADVDTMVQRLREQRKTWRDVEARPAAEGDRVVISFDGWLGQESFTNGRIDNFPVVLGAKQMIPGFEDKLTGADVGAKLEFELEFPQDYPGEKMAGKTGRFAVDVVKIEESLLPEVDADFVKLFGVENGDIEAFRTDIKTNMEREMRRALQTRTKTSVMDALHNRNTFGLPKALVKEELEDLAKPYREEARNRKQHLDEARLKERLEPLANRRVALALVLGKIIDAYNLSVDPGRVRDTVQDLAMSYEDSEEVVSWYYAEKGRLREIENVVMEDQIVDLVLEKATVTDEQVGFHDLMQAAAGNAAPAGQA